ncbi:MAG TPA: flippase activity-associated protein Agl23 [Pyrinomonadaceae bacterium]|nr:flippase activity-associated protein Agl23 [Pyrinomonadaceae bacterium]
MPSASTKQRGRKKARGAASTGTKPAAGASIDRSAATQREHAPEVPERVWMAASAIILLAAALLRLYAPELNPLHHDEGVNGFFLTNLLRTGVYKYDPSNYHGPTLYYFTLPPVVVFGLNTFAIRFVPALAGTMTVWLLLCLRRHIGAVSALAAAALLAVSPGAVYNSRYFIHESLFVFFTVGIVVAAVWFYDTGRAKYLMFAAASAALLFATKETAFISVGVLLLATAIAWAYRYVARATGWASQAEVDRERSRANAGDGRDGEPASSGLAKFAASSNSTLLLVAAAALFIFIYVLFYSSFFTNAQGIRDSFETFKVWTHTASKDHTKPFDTYLAWLQQEEAPVYILAVVGAVWAVAARARNRFAVFAGAWAFGLLLAYSIVKYKTPWLMLNFTVPMAIIGGYGLGALGEAASQITQRERRTFALPVFAAAVFACYVFLKSDYYSREGVANRSALLMLLALVVALTGGWAVVALSEKVKNLWRAHAAALAFTCVAVAVCAYQALVLNFQQYDNEAYAYVYAHTQRGTHELMREVERLAARTGQGKETVISIASPEYWPLPWYFREYTHAGFGGQISPFYDPNQTPIVVGRDSQAAQLRAILGASYAQVGDSFPLRPGVKLIIFARRDLTER